MLLLKCWCLLHLTLVLCSQRFALKFKHMLDDLYSCSCKLSRFHKNADVQEWPQQFWLSALLLAWFPINSIFWMRSVCLGEHTAKTSKLFNSFVCSHLWWALCTEYEGLGSAWFGLLGTYCETKIVTGSIESVKAGLCLMHRSNIHLHSRLQRGNLFVWFPSVFEDWTGSHHFCTSGWFPQCYFGMHLLAWPKTSSWTGWVPRAQPCFTPLVTEETPDALPSSRSSAIPLSLNCHSIKVNLSWQPNFLMIPHKPWWLSVSRFLWVPQRWYTAHGSFWQLLELVHCKYHIHKSMFFFRSHIVFGIGSLVQDVLSDNLGGLL